MTKLPRHGYYEVAGKVYINKLSAFAAAIPNKYFPHWNYYDDRFSKVNWNIEPTESLQELYDQRAMSLRLKYDYLMLSYSGGEDSQTVAEAFIKQGLKLDHLMNRGATESYLDDDSLDARNMDKEAVLAARSQVEKLKKFQPDLKVTYLTWGEDLVQLWREQDVKVDDFSCHSVKSLGEKFTHRFFPEVEKYCNPGLVYGIDKPYLYLIDGKYYMTFADERFTSHILNETENSGESPFEFISFFWDPDAEKILRKQAHVMIRWFEENPQYKSLLTFPKRNTQWGVGAYENLVKELLYPCHDKHLWQTDKSKNFLWLDSEHWWHNHHDSSVVKKWRSIVNEFSNITYDLFNKANKLEHIRKDGEIWQLPTCFSKLHLVRSRTG